LAERGDCPLAPDENHCKSYGKNNAAEQGRQMTPHHPPSGLEGGHPDMDYAEHEATYKLFLALVKYTVLGVVALLAVLALTLT
jgi:hypothetical protein